MEIELTGDTIYVITIENGIITVYYLDGTRKYMKYTLEQKEALQEEMAKPFLKQYEGAKGPINSKPLIFFDSMTSNFLKIGAPQTNVRTIAFVPTYFAVLNRRNNALKKAMEDFIEYNSDIHNTSSIETITNVDDDYSYTYNSYSYVYKK